jgi:hypothetical protein
VFSWAESALRGLAGPIFTKEIAKVEYERPDFKGKLPEVEGEFSS